MNNVNISLAGPEPGSSGVRQQGYYPDIKPIAFQIAAGILLTSSMLSLVGLVFGSPPNVIALIIDVWLAISLLKLSDSARGFALFRAYAGGIIWPIIMFFQNDFAIAAILSVIQLAYCGSLILVLQGKTRNWKLYLAVGVFVVFVLCAMSILYLLAFMGSAGQ